jgi:hypothetical protein
MSAAGDIRFGPAMGLRRRRRLSLMMVFLDESSSFGKDDFVCVGGYLSHDDEWAAFSTEWRMLLNKHNRSNLHTSDFLAGKGEYASL